MKILLKSVCLGLVMTIALSLIPFAERCQDISDKVFRVHILANSDSEEDQELKLCVRDAVIAESEELLCNVHDKSQAMSVISDNLDLLGDRALEVIAENGYDYDVRLSVTNMYFDTRYYDDITMPSGYYDALRIRIGKAEGKNWWCVMYPSLCLYSEGKSDSLKDKMTNDEYAIISSDGKYEFRFKILEFFNDIFEKLR